MRTTPTATGIALLLALATLAPAAGEHVTPLRAKAKFAAARRDGLPRHSLKLDLLVHPSVLLDLHDPGQHDLLVSLGGATLVDAPAGSAAFRTRRDGRWRCRSTGPGGRVVVKADGLTGRVKIKVRGADLHELRDGDGTDLPLVLEVGGAVIEDLLSFDVRRGRVPRWAGLRVASGGGSAPPPATGGPVTFTSYAQGMDSGVSVLQRRVVRTQADWTGLWGVHRPYGGPPPALDLSGQMLIAVLLGFTTEDGDPSRSDTVRVVAVRDTAVRREVVWEVVPDGGPNPCGPSPTYAPCMPARSYHFVLAPASALPVVFVEQ